MDEPESQGAIYLAARENLDNLIFVVNCNLQRLDGPGTVHVTIIQALASTFRVSCLYFLTVMWCSLWYPLLAFD